MTAAPRRRRLSEQERQDQIVAATLRAVERLGYEQASLARVAEEAGVSKGLILHHFGTKDALMEQAARRTLDALRTSVAAELDLDLPVPDVVRAAIGQLARITTTHRTEMTALRRIVPALSAGEGARLDHRAYEETYQQQQVLFERGQAQGTLRAFDTRVMAATYQGAIDTMLGYAEAYPESDIDHYAEQLADLLVAAIEVRP